METRQDRVNALASNLLDSGKAPVTGGDVVDFYQRQGIQVSERQARRDLEEARRRVSLQPLKPGLPDWREAPAVPERDIRTVISDELEDDPYVGVAALVGAVARKHGRSIRERDIVPIARKVYRQLFIMPKVNKARERAETMDPHAFLKSDILHAVDPLVYPNPFGLDANEIRLKGYRNLARVSARLHSSRATLNRADLKVFLAANKQMLQLADTIDAQAGDDLPAVTVERTQTERLQYRD